MNPYFVCILARLSFATSLPGSGPARCDSNLIAQGVEGEVGALEEKLKGLSQRSLDTGAGNLPIHRYEVRAVDEGGACRSLELVQGGGLMLTNMNCGGWSSFASPTIPSPTVSGSPNMPLSRPRRSSRRARSRRWKLRMRS